jgi:hypothetical protein
MNWNKLSCFSIGQMDRGVAQLTLIRLHRQQIFYHGDDLLQDCHYCHALEYCVLQEMLEDYVPSLRGERFLYVRHQPELVLN